MNSIRFLRMAEEEKALSLRKVLVTALSSSREIVLQYLIPSPSR